VKGYVITLLNLPESVKMAERCIASGKQYNVDVEIFPAVYKDVAHNELTVEGLFQATYDESYSNVGAVVGNFVAQYRAWNAIVSSNEPGIILEHDAIFTAPLPPLTGDIINIGKPSYGKFNTKPAPGVYPMFSKPGGYIPGAHGYYLTPIGAQQLIDKAKILGASPCDLFLNNKNFPNILELYPWVVEAHDEFSTIQNEKGCLAKHNYNKEYKII
jgi:GR25 family glycosyltransferase involved in LPS biosynthesis